MCTASAPYSSGSPRRAGCGTCLPSDCCASSGSDPSSGVLNRPGAMVTTRMNSRERSRAIGTVMPTTPPLDAEYAAWPIWPSNAATEAVLMMTPRSSPIGSFLAMRSADRRNTLNVPIRLTSTTFLKASSGKGPSLLSVLAALPIPAQLTLMRSGPIDSATSSALPTAASSVTLVSTNLARSPSAATASSPRRSITTTEAPLSSSRLVVARPSPEAPPVTTATASLIST